MNSIATLAMIGVVLYGFSSLAAAENSAGDIDSRLGILERRLFSSDGKTKEVLVELEQKALKLREESTAQSDYGKIYLTLSRIFSSNGIIEPEKVIFYSEKAARFATTELECVEANELLSSAMMTKANKLNGADWVVYRREIAFTCLNSYKVALRNAPDGKTLPSPSVDPYLVRGEPDSPAVKKILEHAQKQKRDWAQVEEHNRWVELQEGFCRTCVSLYYREPISLNEFRDIALECLKNPKDVNKVLEKIIADVNKIHGDHKLKFEDYRLKE